MNTATGAFTRIELTAVLAATALVAALTLPLLAATRADGDRAACSNNLRQLGRGVRQWAGEHQEEPPWLTSVTQGGTRLDVGSKTAVAWAEYITLSNELVTPRILACPSDVGVRVASNWGNGANGFANAGFRQNALSYILGLHANTAQPLAFIAMDANVQLTTPGGVGCGPSRVSNAAAISTTPFQSNLIGWTNAVHFDGGHYLAVEGSVRFLDSTELRVVLTPPSDSSNHHLLRTR